MTPLPQVQYIVQYDFGDHPHVSGWGYVGECITTLDDAAEAIIDKLGQGYEPDVRRWRVDVINRWSGHSACLSHEIWARIMRLIAERSPDPRDLPEWHPDYPETEPAWPKSLSDLVGGHI
jgi:hypothetical protein